MNLPARLAERGGRAFVPLVYRLAARLEQLSWEELAGDAAYLTFALRSAHELIGTDAVISHFDLALEAEACGARVERDEQGEVCALAPPGELVATVEVLQRGRLPVVLEATYRLCTELEGRLPVLGVLTGPATLAHQLGDAPLDRAAELSVAVARAYCEAGAGGLLVVDDQHDPPDLPAAEGDGGAPELRAIGRALLPLFNVARFFQVPTVYLRRGGADPSAARAAGFDLVAADGGAGTLAPLPPDWPAIPPADLAAWAVERHAEGITTPWEVPPDVPVEHLRELAERLRG
jgi:hypothetical protein